MWGAWFKWSSLIYGQLSCKVEKQQHAIWTVRYLGRCDVDSLVEHLDSAPWKVMDSLEDMDSQWAYWKELFGEIVNSHVPTKKARVKRKAYLGLVGRFVQCWDKELLSRKEEDWEKFKKVRNQLTNCLWRAKLKYFEEMSNIQQRNHGKRWIGW